MRIFGLIPAAGHSRRMGGPKLTLPVGGRTVLEVIVTTLRQAPVERVVVVVGPHVPELADLATRAGASVCLLAEPTPDMRATVEAGLRWLGQIERPQADDAWLLAPADLPALDASVIGQLIEARHARGDCSIVIPTFAGRRGHPTLIDWKHVASLASHPAGLGLNAYLRLYSAETLEVPVTRDTILQDLDTPEDYHRLTQGGPGGPV
jgi:molybdenum cofactor cytidylyltransferase